MKQQLNKVIDVYLSKISARKTINKTSKLHVRHSLVRHLLKHTKERRVSKSLERQLLNNIMAISILQWFLLHKKVDLYTNVNIWLQQLTAHNVVNLIRLWLCLCYLCGNKSWYFPINNDKQPWYCRYARAPLTYHIKCE